MELTEKQLEGVKIAVERYRNYRPWTCISGYAGTGKSTCVKFIIAALGIDPDDVAYITYTGKAASVLRRKGCPNAMTAHKLLYFSKRMPNGGYIYTPRRMLDKNYDLIVVDEISMLPLDLWNLLLIHRVPIIALGDPAQLPPINKNQDNHILDNPHIFLNEIIRQAEDSDIIKLSMKARNNEPIAYADQGQDALVFPESQLTEGMYKWADQIICATNKTRMKINEHMRSMLGFENKPSNGDKVIVCENRWDICDTRQEAALVNGTIGTLQNIEFSEYSYVVRGRLLTVPVIYADIVTGQETFEHLMIDQTALETGKKYLTPQQEYALYKSNPLPIEVNYGYAITCWKAQGSEWDKVLLLEEKFPYDKEEHQKYLYTGITRASEKVVLIK